MTTTLSNHPNETVLTVQTSPAPSLTSSTTSPPKSPNIKRHIELYRYGKAGILGKKMWKECNVIIYDDSTFKIFKDAEGHKASIRPLKLEDVVLDVAFGRSAIKYGPPPIIGDEINYIAPTNFVAIPETKERTKIHWFAAKDEHGLHDLMQVIGEVVAGKVRPPQMGKSPRGRYLGREEHEKWMAYWQHLNEEDGGVHPAVENGDRIVYTPIATTVHPTVAKPVGIPQVPPQHHTVMAVVPSTTNGKSHSTVHSYQTVMEMPKTTQPLRLEPDQLREDIEYDTVPVVRLVNGRRVKENVVRKQRNEQTTYQKIITTTSPGHQKYQPYESQTASTTFTTRVNPTPPPPTVVPTPIIIKTTTPTPPSPKPAIRLHHQQDYKNGRQSNSSATVGFSDQQGRHSSSSSQDYQQQGTNRYPYKSEISTFVSEPRDKSTTQIAITNPHDSFTQHKEHEELVDDRQKTVIDVGTSERVTSGVENTGDAVTYTTTKHSSYHKKTITTSTD